MDTLIHLVGEMNRLIASAHQNQIQLRAFGGLAIFVHSQKDPKFFKRGEPDFDFLVPKNDRQKLEPFFRQMGYSPDKQFNLLNGMRRQIYHYDDSGFPHVDILIGDFEMCHKLPLEGRFDIDSVTIPLTDLLLSKAQVVDLNRKDAMDIISLFLNNGIGDEKAGGIDLNRITSLCGSDWGLYKTLSMNLDRVEELLADKDIPISEEDQAVIRTSVGKIREALEEMPKSMAWQMRDKVGTRVRWYLEVEEVNQ
jgi:hypothetical protein